MLSVRSIMPGAIVALCLGGLTAMAAVPAPKVDQGLRIKAVQQSANSKTQVATASRNVQISYPARQLRARADVAQYYYQEQRLVMTGNVYVTQQGNSLQGETITYSLRTGQFLVVPKAGKLVESVYNAAASGQPRQDVSIRSDRQEANSKTQIVIARNNVQISYPAQRLRAKAQLAQFNAKEQKLVLSGNVVAVQQGNSIQGEVLTYSIKQGQFVALPKSGGVVDSIYVIPEQ
jgi:lipopolysaccharide export system protein LptA